MSGKPDPMFSTWFGGQARLIDLPVHSDARGNLRPLDFASLPFTPRRAFTVTDVPVGSVRGEHGHHSGEQLLICLQGEIELLLKKGQQEGNAVLLPSGPGLLLRAGVWCRQTYLLSNSSLLVLASEPYDPQSYISTWN